MTTATPTPPPATDATEQPATVPSRTQLRRSATDSMLGGVCGGLGEYTGIDTVLWRVGFVVLTLLGGSGVLAYALLWVLVPPAPGRREGPLDGLVGRLHDALTGGRSKVGR